MLGVMRAPNERFWVVTDREVVRVSGPDALGYLQGQVSQDLVPMGIGDRRWTFLLQPTGKVDVLARVERTADDTFVFDVAEHGDRIDDFTVTDFIDLGPLDVDLGFIGDAAFSASGTGEIRYQGGLLSADFDGNGSIDFSVILTGAPTINADQILGI